MEFVPMKFYFIFQPISHGIGKPTHPKITGYLKDHCNDMQQFRKPELMYCPCVSPYLGKLYINIYVIV